MRFKIGPEMLGRTISEQDIRKAKERTRLLEYLGIIEYYDQPEKVYVDVYIPTGYDTIEVYEGDKFEATMLIDSGEPIPKELEQKLVAARIDLEKHGLLEPLT